MNRPTRKQRSERPSNGSHLMIDVFEDGHLQVIAGSEQTPELINVPPLHPTIYDGTFRYDTESIDTESEWSLSMESEASLESESELKLEEVGSRPTCSVPVIEPSHERTGSRKQSISVVSKVRGQAVGAVIDSASTVLMQLSRGDASGHNRLVGCMKEVNEMLNSQNSVVILKYPDVEDSHGSRKIQESHKQTAKLMMEVTEDVLRRVEGSTRKSILVKLQRALGEILFQPEDTIVVHTFSEENIESGASDAFVGYFSTESESAVLVQIPKSNGKSTKSISVCEDDDQTSVDRLRNFLQDSLHGQDDIMEETLDTEPEITISKSGDHVVGVLSFPNASTAVVKTTVQSFSLEQEHAEMVQSMKHLYRTLIQESSEKLLIQTHSNGDRGSKLEQIKTDLDKSLTNDQMDSDASGISVRESDDKVIGVLNYSGGSIVIQTCSKNWVKSHSSASPRDLLKNIRLLIEQFILNNELSDVDLRALAGIIVEVFHSPRIELSREFITVHVLQKIPIVIHQLLNPTDDEDPLLIINQIREILEEIPRGELTQTLPEDFDSLEVLKNYFDELICEEDTIFDNASILHTLREGLLNVLIHYEASLSGALEELLELLRTIPAENIELYSPFKVTSCPGTTNITDEHLRLERVSADNASHEVVQHIHNLLGENEPPGGREVSYISMFQSLFLTILKIIGGWSFRVKSFLDKDARPVVPAEPESGSQPEPKSTPDPSTSLARKPSVSFHLIRPTDSRDETPSDISQQLEEENQTLNNTIDELRQFLEKSLNVPDQWAQDRKGSRMECPEGSSGIKQRMLYLFSQLLDEAGKLRMTDRSTDSIHLRLDTASGELERKESEQYVVLNGNVRDRKHNLGLFFEARMIDLRYASKVESEVERVQEVRRLSDESDQFDLGDLVPEIIESCIAEAGSEPEDEEVETAQTGDEQNRVQESFSRYFDMIQNYIQESMEPMRETLGIIMEKLATVGTEKIREIRSNLIQTSEDFTDPYVVDIIQDDHQDEEISAGVEEVIQEAKSIQCAASMTNQAVQNSEDLQDEASRLDKIEHELRELKDQLKDLCCLLRPPMVPVEPPSIQSIDESPSASTESSQDETLHTIVEPSAPTLEELESLSVMLEILPDVTERTPSQLSDVSDVLTEFSSAIECPVEVELTSEQVPSRKSEVPRVPSECVFEEITIESPHRSMIDQTTVSSNESLLLEEVISAEQQPPQIMEVEKPSEIIIETLRSDDHRRSSVGATAADFIEEAEISLEQKIPAISDGTVVEESLQEITVTPIELAEEVQAEVEIEPSEESSETQLSLIKSSEAVIGQPKLGDQRKSSVDHTEIVDENQDDKSSSIGESPEAITSQESLVVKSTRSAAAIETEQRRSTAIVYHVLYHSSADKQRASRVLSFLLPSESTETQSSFTLSEQRERTSSLVQTSPQESLEEIEQSRRSTMDSIRESIASEQRERTSSLVQTSPQESFEEVNRNRHSTIASVQVSILSEPKERMSSLVQTSPQESLEEISEIHPPIIASVRESLASELGTETKTKRTHELERIPASEVKSKSKEVCDLVLSYKCPMVDEIGQQYTCPAEIYSCHPVGPDQLMVHWEVAPQFLMQISGYKVYVDGQARSISYSQRRRTALIEEINLEKNHVIAIYCTPGDSSHQQMKWAPGIFIYHL